MESLIEDVSTTRHAAGFAAPGSGRLEITMGSRKPASNVQEIVEAHGHLIDSHIM